MYRVASRSFKITFAKRSTLGEEEERANVREIERGEIETARSGR